MTNEGMEIVWINRDNGAERPATGEDIERMAGHLDVTLSALQGRLSSGETVVGSFSMLQRIPVYCTCGEIFQQVIDFHTHLVDHQADGSRHLVLIRPTDPGDYPAATTGPQNEFPDQSPAAGE